MVVLGAGPGGRAAALQAAKVGKRVAIVDEAEILGGACVAVGTLPSKAFRESVYRWSLGSRGTLGQELEHPEEPGAGRSRPEMRRLLRRKDRVIDAESRVVRDQLQRNGVKILSGRGRFASPNELEIAPAGKAPEIVRGDVLVVAVGASPVTNPPLKVDGEFIHDSDTILGVAEVPARLIVVGAGVIGCEYASIFLMAGTHVTLVDRRNEILASVDREIVDHLIDRFEHYGMELALESDVDKVETGLAGAGVRLTLKDGRILEADNVLAAQFRKGNTEGLDLAKAGIEADPRGYLKVDPHFRTSVGHIYAVGDVIGIPALASTSFEQGRIAICHAYSIGFQREMPQHFPYGIYTIPEVSTVGLSEEELKKDGVEYVSGKAHYRELARGLINGDRWGLLKMLIHKRSLKVLGVHIVGDNAADLIHIGQAALVFGADVNYFIRSVFNYPTLAEAYKTAAFHAFNRLHGTTRTE